MIQAIVIAALATAMVMMSEFIHEAWIYGKAAGELAEREDRVREVEDKSRRREYQSRQRQGKIDI